MGYNYSISYSTSSEANCVTTTSTTCTPVLKKTQAKDATNAVAQHCMGPSS